MASSLAHVILSFLLHVLCLLVGPRALAAPIPSAVGEDAWSFFTIGDWGSGTSNQSAVAATMGAWGKRYNPQFIVALGDNFYENGVDSVDDPLWNTRYCSVYTDPALLDVPWYAILGNHDYYGGYADAQIEGREELAGLPILSLPHALAPACLASF
ncbi:purple acid phosphatase [Nannochloropsis gaditana]|uniref:Purple acid phosphatase n=1 Tax=Nannochloropsis gaditana TaxID=72520 RepID=W7T041_9STRA|nr:purple acid phosphatase [Nannochloropsis gaditana]